MKYEKNWVSLKIYIGVGKLFLRPQSQKSGQKHGI